MDAEESLKTVIQRVLLGNLKDKKDCPLSDEDLKIYKCMLSVRGILFNSLLDIPEIAHTINKPEKKDLIRSLVNILSKSWSSNDLRVVLNEMSNDFMNSTDDVTRDYSKCLLQALEGDLVSLARLDDEVLHAAISENEEQTHIRSLLASLITGTTKFDLMDESSKRLDQSQTLG